MRKVLYILTQLSDEDVVWLVTHGVRQRVAEGAVLIRQGVASDALVFVLEGEVSVAAQEIGEVARLGVGEILGEMSLVDMSTPSATVTALRPTQILAIDRVRLTEHLAEDPAFAARFYRAVAMFLSVRLRGTMQRFGREAGSTEEELNMDLLDTIHIAGARFDRMIKDLLGA